MTTLTTRIALLGKDLTGAAFKSVQRNAALLERQIQTTQRRMQSMSMAMAPMSIAGTLGFKKMVNGAIELSAAQGDLNKVWNGTPEQLAQLNQWIGKNSTNLNMMRSEATQAAAEAIQFGVKTEQVSRFMEMSAQASTAFGMSADGAARSLAQLREIMGGSLEKTDQLSNAINHISNNEKETTAAITFGGDLGAVGA